MRIRVGVVGLGENWERRHKPALLRLSEKYEIRAVYDEVAHRSHSQAAELECDAVDGFTCLAERSDIDALYLLGTSWQGVEPVLAACANRKAIMLGRPFAPDVPHTDEAIEAVRNSGVPFMVEFPWRFFPASIRIMELLASGLGTPQLAFCDQRVLMPEGQPRYGSRPLSDTDPRDVAIHMADWLRFVFSRDPVSVQSVGGAELADGPCRGFEILAAEFGDSCLGTATLRRYGRSHWGEAAQFGRPASFQVIAEHGVALLEMPGQVTWFDHSGRHDETLDMERSLGEMLAERFYRIVVHGLNPTPSLADAQWARNMVRDAQRHRLAQRDRTAHHPTAAPHPAIRANRA